MEMYLTTTDSIIRSRGSVVFITLHLSSYCTFAHVIDASPCLCA